MSDKSEKHPITSAVRFLRKMKVDFVPREYEYQEKGGTRRSSELLGYAENAVIKTLVMQDQDKKPLVILMHGDKKVSTKELARQTGAKSIKSCDPATAEKHSGYQVGGTSPFGTRKVLPLFMEESIANLESILINGGKRGFLVEIKSSELVRSLEPVLVQVAIDRD